MTLQRLEGERSGERPKYRLNFDTALRYDCCVAGDRLRTVMSSIMRRRRGLISAIGDLLSEGLGCEPTILSDRSRLVRPLVKCRESGFVQSASSGGAWGMAVRAAADLHLQWAFDFGLQRYREKTP